MIELLNTPFITFSDGKQYVVSYGDIIEFDVHITQDYNFTVPENGTVFAYKDATHDGYIFIDVMSPWHRLASPNWRQQKQLQRFDVYKGQIITIRTPNTATNSPNDKTMVNIRAYYVPFTFTEFNSFSIGKKVSITSSVTSLMYTAPNNGVLYLAKDDGTARNASVYYDTRMPAVISESNKYWYIPYPMKRNETVYLTCTSGIDISFVNYNFS